MACFKKDISDARIKNAELLRKLVLGISDLLNAPKHVIFLIIKSLDD